ncbi:hypothetical protein EVAR_6777_1 [Eumeta japonica]|uniref:Uncharacterized protein n=1 Tax=Eumeta variegata TaxID=151549 RepID=A0A4C1V4C0_EUMVA|nr:hypothetical protein EVAR_6777_1 [Eumeta japonica]
MSETREHRHYANAIRGTLSASPDGRGRRAAQRMKRNESLVGTVRAHKGIRAGCANAHGERDTPFPLV